MPQPDGPTSTMNSPSAISRVTSSTALTLVGNTFVTPSRRMPCAPGRERRDGRRMIGGGGRCLGIHGHSTVTQPSNAFSAGAPGRRRRSSPSRPGRRSPPTCRRRARSRPARRRSRGRDRGSRAAPTGTSNVTRRDAPGASSTRTKLFSSSTGRVTLALRIADVELDDLVALRGAGVRDGDVDGDRLAPGAPRCAPHRRSVELEARVRRGRGRTDRAAPPARRRSRPSSASGRRRPCGRRRPGSARRARIGDRQLAAGVGLADERLGDRRGALLAREPREQRRPRTLVQRRVRRTVGRRRARARPASRSRRRPRRAPPARRGDRARRGRGSRRSCSRR